MKKDTSGKLAKITIALSLGYSGAAIGEESLSPQEPTAPNAIPSTGEGSIDTVDLGDDFLEELLNLIDPKRTEDTAIPSMMSTISN
ncbi:MAG: hypothetical protein HRU19_16180 [Pseudobacteriovorax sp.]|nr:hypothetical protein [Pseudobacteriovorax sp.]